MCLLVRLQKCNCEVLLLYWGIFSANDPNNVVCNRKQTPSNISVSHLYYINKRDFHLIRQILLSIQEIASLVVVVLAPFLLLPAKFVT